MGSDFASTVFDDDSDFEADSDSNDFNSENFEDKWIKSLLKGK